ncbi:hypothetical protein BJX99DRAFT_226494 [Aspergillus californicus]
MAAYMPAACLSCAAKKRKCDRSYPWCSRCCRLKTTHDCVYRAPIEDQLLGLNGRDASQSAVSCEKCRVGKRACSRDLPSCSRCDRLDIPCDYKLGKEYTGVQASQEFPLGDASRPSEGSEGPAISRRIISPQMISELQYKPRYPIPERNYFASLLSFYTETCFMPPLYRVRNSLTTHLHGFWMSRALADPCLFTTVLFSASAHRDSIRDVCHSKQTLYHQSLALKMLRERLKENTQISYEVAGSALALTFYNVGITAQYLQAKASC